MERSPRRCPGRPPPGDPDQRRAIRCRWWLRRARLPGPGQPPPPALPPAGAATAAAAGDRRCASPPPPPAKPVVTPPTESPPPAGSQLRHDAEAARAPASSGSRDLRRRLPHTLLFMTPQQTERERSRFPYPDALGLPGRTVLDIGCATAATPWRSPPAATARSYTGSVAAAAIPRHRRRALVRVNTTSCGDMRRHDLRRRV